MSEIAQPRPRYVWAMGLCEATYGFAFAAILVTMPQVMAAHGVGQPVIAGVTALATAASLGSFIVAPALDTMISRRAWTLGLGVLVAVLVTVLLAIPPASVVVAPLMAIAALGLVMFSVSLGGWLGAALPKDLDDTIATWFTMGNAGGFGIGALCQYWLINTLSPRFGPLAVGLITLIPLAGLGLIPMPDAGPKAVRESFGTLARDLSVLVRQPVVLRIALLFAMPCAAFTLTNAFGGLGLDFHVSAATVDLANGFGATVVGMGSALLAKWCLRHVHAPLLYLGIGTLGAIFTATIIGLPHTAPVYLLAVIGENMAQSMAQVSQGAIQFGSIRKGSPLAASQFGLLGTAALLPYSYMQALDGYGYHLAGNVAGSFWMDAGVSLVGCAILLVPVLHWMRRGKLAAPDDLGPDDLGPDDLGPDDVGPDDVGPADVTPDEAAPVGEAAPAC